MKLKFYIILLLTLVSFTARAQIINIPDVNFKWALVNTASSDTDGDGYADDDVDTNNDGEIQLSEAKAVIGLYVNGRDIASVEGLEYFINLETLSASFNQITSIEVSNFLQLKNLRISHNHFIESLDVTQNLNLEVIICGTNLISTLDVSQNLNLKELNCGSNQLSSMDVSLNSSLEKLAIPDNNLTNIDISHNTNLVDFNCQRNQIVTLDVSQNTLLTILNVSINPLTALDISNIIELELLLCFDTNIESLDISANSQMVKLNCYDNTFLTSLNINNGNNTSLIHFEATENPNLNCIQVDNIEYADSQECVFAQWESWCKDDWAEYSEDCNLGIQEILATQIVIYPNPVHTILNLENNSSYTIISIHLYDVLGRLVLQEQNPIGQLDISTLNSGLFFVQLETDKGVIVKKIVKL